MTRSTQYLGGALLALVIVLAGCLASRPVSPDRAVSFSVSVPSTNEVRSSLLTSSSNELLYRIDGQEMTPIKGTLGPFSSASATGAINFTVDVPGGGKRVLSLQLNDATTHQPLGIGAVGIDLGGGSAPVSNLAVNLGSVVRNCYNIGTAAYYTNTAYGFNSNQLAIYLSYGPTYDIAFNPIGGGYQIIDAQGNTAPYNASSIAFLGNGDFVDHDVVPPDSDFYSQSSAAKAASGAAVTIFEAGDIYCVKLATIPGAHAWIRVKTPGAGMTSPSVQFRVNDTQSFFSYYRTPPDTASATPCPAH